MILEGHSERWSAFDAMARHDSAEALEALIELSASPDYTIRRASISAMAQMSNAPEYAHLLKAFLLDKSAYVVRAACNALAELDVKDAHDSILALVSNEDDATRETAVRALRNLWQPEDFDKLFDIFSNDGNENVRKEAAWTLHHVADEENWTALFKAWQRDNTPRHREWACELVNKFGNAGQITELERLMTDTNGHVREAAQKAMMHITECQTR